MSAAQRAFVLAETYEDVEKLIFSTANRFVRKYGVIDPEEAVAVGHEIFMRITNPNDPIHYRRERGSFSNWLRYKHEKALLEMREREASRHARLPRAYPNLERQASREPAPGRLLELLDELTTDARIVARLALNAPMDVRLGAIERGGSMRAVKDALKEYLTLSGWSVDRIENCFDEITAALG